MRHPGIVAASTLSGPDPGAYFIGTVKYQGANTGLHNYYDVPIGPPSPSRVLLIAAVVGNDGATPSYLELDGARATLDHYADTSPMYTASMWRIAYPTGDTVGTLKFKMSGSQSGSILANYSINGATVTLKDVDTNIKVATSFNDTVINTPNTGFTIVSFCGSNGNDWTAGVTGDWSGYTTETEGSRYFCGTHRTSSNTSISTTAYVSTSRDGLLLMASYDRS